MALTLHTFECETRKKKKKKFQPSFQGEVFFSLGNWLQGKISLKVPISGYVWAQVCITEFPPNWFLF